MAASKALADKFDAVLADVVTEVTRRDGVVGRHLDNWMAACSRSYQVIELSKLGDVRDLTSYLVKQNPDVNVAEVDGEWTALHYASFYGHWQLVKVLLKARANLNVRDAFGYTPLHLAALEGHQTVSEILLRSGVDVHLKNKSGQTAIDIARLYGQDGLVTMLKLVTAASDVTKGLAKHQRKPPNVFVGGDVAKKEAMRDALPNIHSPPKRSKQTHIVAGGLDWLADVFAAYTTSTRKTGAKRDDGSA